MSFEIYARNEADPIPRKVVWAFRCDGLHGPFDVPLWHEFSDYDSAMRAGWKETFIDGERRFLGPCCSGKRAK